MSDDVVADMRALMGKPTQPLISWWKLARRAIAELEQLRSHVNDQAGRDGGDMVTSGDIAH